MFGNKDKDKNKSAEPEKAPTSFTSPNTSSIPKVVNKETRSKSNSTTLIAKDTEILGDVIFSGSLEIEGKVRGNIRAKDMNETSIRVLEEGSVEGDINVFRANLNGDVKGNVQAKTVELAAKARIEGNVYYETLEMTKGAQVNGSLVYGEKTPTNQVVKVENKDLKKP